MEFEWDIQKNQQNIMKDKNTVKYTRNNIPVDTESDLVRIHTMTDEEIERAALADPDAQPLNRAFLDHAQIVISFPVDQETLRWYQSQGKNMESLLQEALKSYKEMHLSS